MDRQPLANFPPEYHAACRYLVRFGSRGGDARVGRLKIATALRALRAIDRAWAADCRKGMRFVAGCFPQRPVAPQPAGWRLPY